MQRFQFTLEQSGVYRVLFTTTEGEHNADRSPYHLTALHRHADVTQHRASLEDLSEPVS